MFRFAAETWRNASCTGVSATCRTEWEQRAWQHHWEKVGQSQRRPGAPGPSLALTLLFFTLQVKELTV